MLNTTTFDKIDIHVSNVCNLKCKHCSHFSALSSNEPHPDLTTFENDFKNLKRLAPDISRIDLSGGEPLLNPNLEKYIAVIRKYYDALTDIVIFTNGTLSETIPDSLLKYLSKMAVHIKVSYYKAVYTSAQLSSLSRLFLLSHSANVTYEYSIRQIYPVEFLTLRLKRDKSTTITQREFDDCMCHHCSFVQDGKLYICPLPARIHLVNARFNERFEVTDKDYLVLKDIKDKQQILEFLSHPSPFCGYCDMADRKTIPWEQGNQTIDEYIIP